MSTDTNRNQWGLRFVDQLGRLELQNEDHRSNALFDVNGHEIGGVFVL